MQRNFNANEMAALDKISYLVGSSEQIQALLSVSVKQPFDSEMVEFLNALSKELMGDIRAKRYPDVVTLGFWMRKASIKELEKRFGFTDAAIHLGCGTVFHIAPSNVPVNFAYSLVAGLLMGNANVVRVPSKDFPQVDIIVDGIRKALAVNEGIKPYINLVRYDREKEINDVLSSIADVRVIWGGDQTIGELRRSPLPPRSSEITFADRFSIAVIDAEAYLSEENHKRIASDFYNDTYLSDQNACTSPRLVVWTGSKIAEAKEIFWKELHELVKARYAFQDIMGVNKLTKAYLMSAHRKGTKIIKSEDNLLIRVQVPEVTEDVIELRDSSGYFYEYDCDDLMDLRALCCDKRLQTIAVLGDAEMLKPLILSGIKGIDRVVPVGHTMDFDLLWDGYNLSERLTRTANCW